jgi:hypothetical protein
VALLSAGLETVLLGINLRTVDHTRVAAWRVVVIETHLEPGRESDW